MAKINDVQVILSDQRMSDMSGTEFLGRVKMLYPDTVRLVLSGYTDLNTVTDAINRGAIYRFLTKPWNDDDLRVTVALASLKARVSASAAAGENPMATRLDPTSPAALTRKNCLRCMSMTCLLNG